jgi:threonine synthase
MLFVRQFLIAKKPTFAPSPLIPNMTSTFKTTSGQEYQTSFADVVLKSLAPDGSLYMLPDIQPFTEQFLQDLIGLSFPEMAFKVSQKLIGQYIDHDTLKAICNESFKFLVPFIPLGPEIYVMELFHGPSGAFKDFGARFMARLLPLLVADNQQVLDILVATSGDTGGAVAMGFDNVPNTRVTILYPKGKVTPLQEAQLTTHGKNVIALEIEGTFDDCQALVKQAFNDVELANHLNLTSANSINVARILPQSFYYVWAWMHLQTSGLPIVISVPSGNFGNVYAGIYMKQCGFPIHSFIASNNANHPY